MAENIPQSSERERMLQELGVQMTRTENFIQTIQSNSGSIGHLSGEDIKNLSDKFRLFTNSVHEALTKKEKGE